MSSDEGNGYDYDPIPDAREVLRRLSCAADIRRIADEEADRYGPDERVALLREAANIVEHSGPRGGLLTLGVYTENIHPDDVVWLLQECVEGRNSGAWPDGAPGRIWEPWIRIAQGRPDGSFEWVRRDEAAESL